MTQEIIDSAPHGELISYPVSHFEFYKPEVREKVLVDQIAFKKKHLANGA